MKMTEVACPLLDRHDLSVNDFHVFLCETCGVMVRIRSTMSKEWMGKTLAETFLGRHDGGINMYEPCIG